jgi:hypothetical protein
MKGNECLATMKHTFDTHYSGNRVPMTVNMHPDYYMKSRDAHYKSAGNHLQRRKMFEDFMHYVLQNPDVRVIAGHSLIAWMTAPVALSENMPVLDERGEPVKIQPSRGRPVRKPSPEAIEHMKQEQETQQRKQAEEEATAHDGVLHNKDAEKHLSEPRHKDDEKHSEPAEKTGNKDDKDGEKHLKEHEKQKHEKEFDVYKVE